MEDCKQAFEKARAAYGTGAYDDATLEFLFPQLKEGEDERIRKYLIEGLKVAKSIGELKFTIPQPTREECIAYLEKQKESPKKELGKYSEEEELAYRLNWVMQDYYKAGKDDEEKEHRFKCYKLFWDALEDENFFEQKEQKTAGWSEDYREEDIQTRFAFYTYKDDPSVLYLSNVFVEETSRNHGFGTRILKAAEKAAEAIGAITICLKVKQDSPANAWYRKRGYGYVAFEDGYDWLEKNLEYLKPVKQEWSDEDEDNLHRVIRVLKDNDSDWKELSDWLKSLRPQPKEEWSEEDEEMLEEIINHIDTTSVQRIPARPGSAIGKSWIKFLKSLRPQPKQEWSEEDIKKIRSEEYTKGFNDAAFGGKLKEWSVEDEDRIRQIERIAQQAGCTQKLQEEIHDWLKSLRPSWRPSEEQMKALQNAVALTACDKELARLYNQLNKLM